MKNVLILIVPIIMTLTPTVFATELAFHGSLGYGIPYGVVGLQAAFGNEYFDINAHIGLPIIETGDGVHPKGYGLKVYPNELLGIEMDGIRTTVATYYAATTLMNIYGRYYYFWQYSLAGGIEYDLPNKWILNAELVYAMPRTKNGFDLPSGFKIAVGVGYRFSMDF